MTDAKTLPQYVAATCICLGAMGTGTVLGWTSNITDNLRNGDLNGLKMTSRELGFIGLCCTSGATLACFPIGLLADYVGRRRTCLATIMPFTLGWLLIMKSKNFLMIYFGRALTGAAGGAFLVVAPIYTSEIAQTHIRGTLGTLVQVFLVSGLLYVEVLGWALPMTEYIMACMMVPIIFAVSFTFQPETPFYNLMKGNPEKAKECLRRLRGDNYDLEEELEIITQELEEDRGKGSIWADLKTKANKKAICICLSLMLYQQFTGITVMFCAKDILIQARSIIPPHFTVMGIGAASLITVILASSIIDRKGSRYLLQMSCTICAFATFLLGFYFSLKYNSHLKQESLKIISLLPILSLMFLCVGFNLGLGPIPWLESAELFSPAVKEIMGSTVAMFNLVIGSLVASLTRYCLTEGEKVRFGMDILFYIFSCVCISCVFFDMFLVPETNKKRYYEIKEELEQHIESILQ